MLFRRCAVLYLEPREDLRLDVAGLFSGGSGLAASMRWVALAPHLDREIDVHADELPALGAIGPTVWQERAALETQFGAPVIARLLEAGLLVADDAPITHWRKRDDTLRAQHWRPLSAASHVFSRWHGMRAESGMQFPTFEELVRVNGMPPEPAVVRCAAERAIALPAVEGGGLDHVLLQRYTGRNFDAAAVAPLALAARLLQRTFGAQGQREMAPGAAVLKKTSPSAGGLHPIEAYLLVQRLESVAPGLYHYHALDHTLEPLQSMPVEQVRALACQAVADQHWFADAPMMVVLAARVARNFWKYRNHAKAYRALDLDAGHLSQTFYLLAAEAGMPAFVTAAINEPVLEQALGLDPLCDAVLAVCGCGAAGAGDHVELRGG